MAAGIAVAGIDAGDTHGNPQSRELFTKLHEELTTRRGFAAKVCLLARSRGGLFAYNWASEHPHLVAGIAGIYPVCDLRSYPGLQRACRDFGLSAADLAAELERHNPVDRLEPLAKAGVPLFAIHGDVDTLVPLEANSAAVKRRYEEIGGSMQLVVPAGQGHNFWEGFFRCQELVDFVIAAATRDR
jgi:pimeloyl-ACP methyl ester carboxylesterase